uniref:hypothetical protein n=1 Tax=Pseudomonas sp. TaxID=306 RepID=UPI00289CCFA7
KALFPELGECLGKPGRFNGITIKYLPEVKKMSNGYQFDSQFDIFYILLELDRKYTLLFESCPPVDKITSIISEFSSG